MLKDECSLVLLGRPWVEIYSKDEDNKFSPMFVITSCKSTYGRIALKKEENLILKY